MSGLLNFTSDLPPVWFSIDDEDHFLKKHGITATKGTDSCYLTGELNWQIAFKQESGTLGMSSSDGIVADILIPEGQKAQIHFAYYPEKSEDEVKTISQEITFRNVAILFDTSRSEISSNKNSLIVHLFLSQIAYVSSLDKIELVFSTERPSWAHKILKSLAQYS